MAKATLDSFIDSIHGRIGDTQVSQRKTGTVISERPRYRRTSSDLQKSAQTRMKIVNGAWETFSVSEVKKWNLYAKTQKRRDAITGKLYLSTGYNLFVAYSVKHLQISPEAQLPRTPPTSPFVPRFLTLTSTGGVGVLTVTANFANSIGSLTEILLQKLPNPRRQPTANYVSKAFVPFTGSSPSFTLALTPGCYAVATRFVDPNTGQMTPMAVLEAVEVSAMVILEITNRAA